MPELVVLLHGILRSRIDMAPLARHLRRRGYETLNILYPARRKNLESLVDYIDEKIRASSHDPDTTTIHFVTHSMGGLVARYYIASRRPKKLGRVVMLAPPNTGSEFADVLSTNKFLSRLYNKMFGPAGVQLTTAYRHSGTIDFPLGIIAGTRSVNPLAFWGLKNTGPHDGIVPVGRTKIEGMRDHILVPASHAFIMFRPDVMEQVEHFLKEEKFLR